MLEMKRAHEADMLRASGATLSNHGVPVPTWAAKVGTAPPSPHVAVIGAAAHEVRLLACSPARLLACAPARLRACSCASSRLLARGGGGVRVRGRLAAALPLLFRYSSVMQVN